MPRANKPEIVVLRPVDRSVLRTNGINKGLRNPLINTIAPAINLPFGGTEFFSIKSISLKALLSAGFEKNLDQILYFQIIRPRFSSYTQ